MARAIVFRTAERVVSEAGWYEGGYRAQVVAYICARLARLATEVSRDGRLDFRRIWVAQACDAVLQRQIGLIGEAMMRVLRKPPREGQNIGEWAKQQACRESALRAGVPVVPGIEGWVVDADTARAEVQEARAAGRVDEDLRMIQEVLAIPSTVWSSLRQHSRRAGLIQPNDEAALRAACAETGRPPNEIQARRLMALLERAREGGWEEAT